MAGYTASSRLQGAVPRFAGAGPSVGGAGPSVGGTAPSHAVDTRPAVTEPAAVDQVELVGQPLDESIRDWLASVGESWTQLTFYLFDPESWR